MDVKVFLLLFIFQICGVVSKNCSCFVGYAKSTGEVHLQLEDCPPLPTMPPSIETTSAAPTTGVPTQKPDTTTQKPTTTEVITTNEPVIITETPEASTKAPESTTKEPDVTFSADASANKTNATTAPVPSTKGDKRRRRDVQEPACRCQIAVLNENQSDKLKFNATGWTANFTCFNSSLENVIRKCSSSGCNDIKFLKDRRKQLKVPDDCKKGNKTKDFLFETRNRDRIESCNDQSRNQCLDFNVTQIFCSKESGFCCCPLPEGYCSNATSPPPISTAVPIYRHTSKKHGAVGTHNNKSFDWRIVGYIGTGVICGIFLTFVGRFIYGKKKNDQLQIPNYKYSRLRADYVDQDL